MIFRHRIRKILISDHPKSIIQVFENSRIYGARYEEPPRHHRLWPRSTWLQKRLAELNKK
jgi:hypothetical protein